MPIKGPHWNGFSRIQHSAHGRRIDAVILVGGIVFVIEFKVGEKSFDSAALDQVWDYALDLKNFIKASHALQSSRSSSPRLRLVHSGIYIASRR
jgi:hypothetical protein